jgi:alpha-1,6-mannosyltransferase
MAIKTLHITNAWHATSGGVSTFYRALIQAANRRGHQIRLIVPGANDRVEETGPFARIYTVAAPAARLNPAYRTIYPSKFLWRGSQIQELLAAERPDLIEISDKYSFPYLGGLLRLRLLRAIDFRPVIVGLSNERMDDNFRSYLGWLPLGRRFCSWYMHWIYFPFFDYHIANSSYTAEELQAASRGHLVPRDTWIRPMGADLGEMSPAQASPAGRRRLLSLCGAPDDAILLFYAGRLVPEKNLQLLFELTEHLNRTGGRPFHLMVAGDGIERPRWERYAAERLPGHAVFLGHIRDRKMLATLYANSDIFIHPNSHEPFGIAPLEAMASGLPLLAPNAGGVISYASPANAWTVPPTVTDFAEAVQEILSQRELVAQKTERARQTAGAYNWDCVADGFLDLYQDMYRRFRGEAATLTPDFSSVPAAPTTARVARWTAQFAQKAFGTVSRLRERPGAQSLNTKEQEDGQKLQREIQAKSQ